MPRWVRVFLVGFSSYTVGWRPMVAVLAARRSIVGASLAIVQSNVKRTLAYSSINHAGFILMALATGTDAGSSAVLFYLITCTFMVIGSFGIVSIVARKGDGRVTIDDYRGLAHSNPRLAGVMTVFLLAQAGMPLTSGFVAKLYAIDAVVGRHADWIAVVAMLTGAVAAFLYLRIVVAMYLGPADEVPATPHLPVPIGTELALGICFVVTLGVGLAPETVVSLTEHGRPYLVEAPGLLTPPPPGSATGSGS